MSPSIILAVLFVSAITLYKVFVYPVFLSPLSKIPTAHWSCSFSPAWLLWQKWTHRENRSVYKRHMKSGSVIRLAPSVLSVNCVEDGLKTIYQGGFPKPEFYSRGFAIYGTDNVFTFLDNETHSTRRRLISNTFSKSFVLSSPTARSAMRDILDRYLPRVRRAALENQAVEVLELNYGYFMDTFVYWQFGKGLASNFIEDQNERKMYFKAWFGLNESMFWSVELPGIASFLRKVGIFLIPKWVDDSFGEAETWNLEKCDQAHQLLASGEELHSDDQPVVFAQAMKTMSNIQAKPHSYPQRLEVASDMFTHSSAAFETSGNTVSYLTYELCRNPEWQRRLREELLTLGPQSDALPIDVDNLPILHALLLETLRLYPSVPGGLPRVVPKSCKLGDYHSIPTGTVVQSYAYTLHKTPSVFPEPHEWKPERWLESSAEQLAEMRRWFWPFASGGRMCLGSHFAIYAMKSLVAAIYTEFTTSLHDHGDMELLDAFLAGPKGRRLEVKFHPVVSGDGSK